MSVFIASVPSVSLIPSPWITNRKLLHTHFHALHCDKKNHLVTLFPECPDVLSPSPPEPHTEFLSCSKGSCCWQVPQITSPEKLSLILWRLAVFILPKHEDGKDKGPLECVHDQMNDMNE